MIILILFLGLLFLAGFIGSLIYLGNKAFVALWLISGVLLFVVVLLAVL